MMTCREFHELHRAIDAVYDAADRRGYTWQELAGRAGLCYSTVRNLAKYNTMYPRAQTVMLLARAVGLRLVLAPRRPARAQV